MLWKVFNINTGKILKAGFESEEQALGWLDLQTTLKTQNFAVDEMEADEEEEWSQLSDEEEEEARNQAINDTEEEDTFALNYAQEDHAEGDAEGLDVYSEFDPDED